MAQAGPHLMNLAFLNQLQMYMTRIRLPSREQKKVTAYYKYLFRQNSFYDSESLNLLSGTYILDSITVWFIRH